jgi:hypothetical protein
MKLSFIAPLLLMGIAAWAQEGMPRMTMAEPNSGKKGDVVAVSGENLDKAHVAKVYLTDGKNDLECEVTEQTATAIKLKIPDKAKGRMAVMVLTAAKEPSLIEQPVKVTIEQ